MRQMAEVATTEILIHSEFYDDLLERFKNDMAKLTTPGIVVLDIQSYGGYVYILEEMVNMIRAKKEEGYVFMTNVENYAYSCGFMLFLIGDIKTVSDTATLMYHDAGLEVWDRLTAADAKEIYESLLAAEAVGDRLLRENTDLTEEMISFLKRNESFFNKTDLIHFGIMQKEYTLN